MTTYLQDYTPTYLYIYMGENQSIYIQYQQDIPVE